MPMPRRCKAYGPQSGSKDGRVYPIVTGGRKSRNEIFQEPPRIRGRADGWRPRQESNLYLPLRRGLFYPLNHGAAPGEFCTMTEADDLRRRR